jgi:hypothetical protein
VFTRAILFEAFDEERGLLVRTTALPVEKRGLVDRRSELLLFLRVPTNPGARLGLNRFGAAVFRQLRCVSGLLMRRRIDTNRNRHQQHQDD